MDQSAACRAMHGPSHHPSRLDVSGHTPLARRDPPLHSHPAPRPCRPARPFVQFFDARLTRSIAAVFLSPEPRRPKLGRRPVWPGFAMPFGFGRPRARARKPWPTCDWCEPRRPNKFMLVCTEPKDEACEYPRVPVSTLVVPSEFWRVRRCCRSTARSCRRARRSLPLAHHAG